MYLLNPLHPRDTILDIEYIHYNCHHTPHACLTPISSDECFTKTYIRHTISRTISTVCVYFCVFRPAFCHAVNKRRLIDWLILCTLRQWQLTRPRSDGDFTIRSIAPVNGRSCTHIELVFHGLKQLSDDVARLVCWQLHRAASTLTYKHVTTFQLRQKQKS